MKRNLIMSLSLSLWAGISFSQTILQPGDIAIVGYNFKNPDEFTFITFVDLEPGTVIYITDCGWTSSDAFRVGEGIVTYTVPPEGKPGGSAVTFGLDPGFTTTGVSGFFGLSTTGDQLIVYQGSFSSPQFIYALNCNENAVWQSSAPDNNTSALPPGLVNGYSAVALIEKQNGIYNCSYAVMDKALLLPLISDFNNWQGDNDNRYLLPPSCFTDPLNTDITAMEARSNDKLLELNISIQPAQEDRSYMVELSEDYLHYDPVSSISIEKNTNYFSCKIPISRNYQAFRLRAMNSSRIEGPRNIDRGEQQTEISISPNPYTSGNIRIFVPGQKDDYKLQLLNSLGQIILTLHGNRVNVEAGLEKFARQAIKGSYFVVVQDKSKIYRQMLIIE